MVTSNYYHGGQLVAMKENTTLRYVHQDHLTGTSLMTGNTGSQIGATMKYLPFGGTRSGSVPTDKKFTGQRLDTTGLYYYNARYYDPTIGRFISPDTIVPNPANPQSFNRYSYCLNNPLKYTDPSGHVVLFDTGVDWSDGDYLYNCQQATKNTKPLVDAYNKFRSIDPILTKTLEVSERTIMIGFGDTNLAGGPFTPDSTFTRNGDDRNIIIDSTASKADSSWLASQIYTQATNFVDIYAPFINTETAYDLLGFIPFGKWIGLIGDIGRDASKYYQVAKVAFGLSGSWIEFRSLYGSDADAFISLLSTIGGVSPAWIPAAFLQLGWDLGKAGTEFA